MPTSQQILEGLGGIANGWRWLAVAWHLYFGMLALGLLVGVRPSRRLAGILLALPLASVSTLAWVTGNPFNGAAFGGAGLVLFGVAAHQPREPVAVSAPPGSVPGAGLFAFGWVYPHFLDTPTWLPYLYAAPTGLVPCPTLSAVIGLALILGGLGSRTWSLVLAATGLSYGVFGATRFDVTMDWVLAAGALALLAIAFRPLSPRRA